jgi:hypothetical protein
MNNALLKKMLGETTRKKNKKKEIKAVQLVNALKPIVKME